MHDPAASSAGARARRSHVGGEGQAMNDTRDLSTLLYRIEQPIVCSRCADEVEAGEAGPVSMAEYGRLEVGFTEQGLQVWCRRHGGNVVHFDFEGRAPPADFRSLQRRMSPSS